MLKHALINLKSGRGNGGGRSEPTVGGGYDLPRFQEKGSLGRIPERDGTLAESPKGHMWNHEAQRLKRN